MSKKPLLCVAALSALLVCSVSLAQVRELTFEERVRAQEAIERVYYSYQLEAGKPFEKAVSRETLERKVRDYLKQSVSLERLWNTTITFDMLDREVARMSRDSRASERLAALFEALDDDPLLIRECLARPILVERMVGSFFDWDRRIHFPTRRRMALQHRARRDGDSRQLQPGVKTSALDLVHVDDAEANGEETQYRSDRAQFPRSTNRVGPIEQTRHGFRFRVLESEGREGYRGITYSVRKTSRDRWWQENRDSLDESTVRVAQPTDPQESTRSYRSSLPDPTGAPCSPDDTWHNGSLGDVPEPRASHAAVWTGSLMLVWGGSDNLNTGYRYDPATDTWSAMSTLNAPHPRALPTAVWTGAEMIVYGGESYYYGELGGRYDPITDVWIPISTDGAPGSRENHTAVWTGTEMIVWGGWYAHQTGARYNPTTDSWQAMSTNGAPEGRREHTAVWTGSEMIVWGGVGYNLLGDGGRYDPATDSWTPVSSTDAPTKRNNHAAVWTGDEMIVWAGAAADNSGGRYDPQTDSWTPTSLVDAPDGRYNHTAVWIGDRMIVWGGMGYPAIVLKQSGGIYDPVTDSWIPTDTTNAPIPRQQHTAVWTGERLIVWGGAVEGFNNNTTQTGGRYDPVSDSWTPTSTGNAPSGRAAHKAVWTGGHVVVWGGHLEGYGRDATDTGGRYDPATDNWRATSLLGAPSPRTGHGQVWTGSEVIVWGGTFIGGTLETGGRYDPIADRWQTPSTENAPDTGHSPNVFWTGELMLVWDPWGDSSGGRYDPETDFWTPMATTGGPITPYYSYSAVWTGTEMILWGGDGGNGVDEVDLGWRYDPSSDSWAPTTTEGAPEPRRYHSAVWSGTEMIVWGGKRWIDELNTGGRYDPGTDSWQPTSTVDAPLRRTGHSAVWTGREMIIWGGGDHVNTGGRYDPSTDSWQETSVEGAPSGRGGHTAIWTGSHMMVWGGGLWYSTPYGNGGLYALGHDIDDDNDGFSECAGDCNDRNDSIHPDADELCDTLDNDCDGEIDEGFDADADGVGDCVDNCPTTPNEDQVDEDNDGLGSVCDNCPAISNSDQSDTVHPNGIGDACDDPDGDEVMDGTDICPDTFNPAQAETVACISLTEDGGQCLEANLTLLADVPEGEISIYQLLGSPISSITFEILSSSCEAGSDLTFFLNDVELGLVVLDPDLNCHCLPPVQQFTVSDSALLRSIWNAGGLNTIRLIKTGSFGNFFGWVRMHVESEDGNGDACLLDSDGGDCDVDDLCQAGFSSLPFDREVQVSDPSLASVPYSATPVEDSILPGLIAIESLPAGPAMICVATLGGAEDCVRFTAAGEHDISVNDAPCGPPAAVAGPGQLVECESAAGTLVTLDGSGSSDPNSSPGTNDDIVLFEWYELVGPTDELPLGEGELLVTPLALGDHGIRLRVTDSYGNFDEDELWVTVQDSTPPELAVSLAPDTLWPPNHRMVQIDASLTVSDNCSTPTVVLTSFASSEVDNGEGDGNTTNDIQGAEIGTADKQFQLRAERSGSGDGRIYTAAYLATDASGNARIEAGFAVVPHDQGGSIDPIEALLDHDADGTWVSWSAAAGAESYSVIRGALSAIVESDVVIDLGVVTCVEGASTDTSTEGFEDAEAPAPGEAFFYLVDYFNGTSSTYGTESASKPRAPAQGACQ